MKTDMKMIFISWQPHCSRSDNIAKELAGKSYMVYYSRFGSNYATIIFKYLFQMIKTLLILIKNRPKIIFVMCPPLFACIPVFIYCKIFKTKYIIDAHTGAFTNPLWKKVIFLQKFFSKNAHTNIITNVGLEKYLKDWNAPSLIISDVPIIASNAVIPKLKNGNNVTLINSFAIDEPLEEFLDATKELDDINFYVTGKIGKENKKYTNMAGKNVKFTDYLKDEEYFGLIMASDVVVVLTNLDNTMQRGAYEAIYNGKPIITSGWDVLRENFREAAVFVDNTSSDIKRGIKDAFKNLEELNRKAIELKKQKIINWEKNKSVLTSYIINNN